ncbi:helix-turn-helix domain-containing protein [Vibrio sp. DW001]|uniref:LexA family transcriptional regulator n=1 Tax=Vibrio sp. DW001 TaxID=2912315 RepID=UPI0023AF7485|nr:S24 family peptidase [Vibrio sp. DW001]WED26424.1 helix-turn-helix domain-containing protein [Vibrio sp. DW001]
MSDKFDEALNELKIATGTTKNKDLADFLGIAANTIQGWRIRGKIPERIYEQVKITSRKDAIAVRLYDVAASAGAGSLVEYEPSRVVELSESLRLVLGISSAIKAKMLYMQGDSMVPTLQDGSLVAIEAIENFVNDGIYVFDWEGELFIKRLQRVKDGVQVMSDNDKYKTWEITRGEMQDRQFIIMGRVTGCCQRL